MSHNHCYYYLLPCFDERQSEKWNWIQSTFHHYLTDVNKNWLPRLIYTHDDNNNRSSSMELIHMLISDDDESVLTNKEKDRFFTSTLPCMVQWVLDMPQLFTLESIPFLLKNRSSQVKLNRVQCRCLLSCAFFCLLEKPRSVAFGVLPQDLYRQCVFQDIVNFHVLYSSEYNNVKLRCLIEVCCIVIVVVVVFDHLI